MGVQVYWCTGVWVYRCMGVWVWDTFLMHQDNLLYRIVVLNPSTNLLIHPYTFEGMVHFRWTKIICFEELLALVIMYMSSILSAVHFVAVFSSINVQLFECTRSVFTSITSKMIFRCTKIISCEEILVFPIKIMYLFSRSTKFPIYYLLYNLFSSAP